MHNDKKRLLLLLIPAALFAAGAGAYAETANGQWETDSRGIWYSYEDGSYAKKEWLEIDGAWYYFNDWGYAVTGWKKIGRRWYLFDQNGVMLTGWQTLRKKTYYLNPEGAMQTGWKEIDGKWYFFRTDGSMQTGWKMLSGKWYYFRDGVMVTGEQMIDNVHYTFKDSGILVTKEDYPDLTVQKEPYYDTLKAHYHKKGYWQSHCSEWVAQSLDNAKLTANGTRVYINTEDVKTVDLLFYAMVDRKTTDPDLKRVFQSRKYSVKDYPISMSDQFEYVTGYAGNGTPSAYIALNIYDEIIKGNVKGGDILITTRNMQDPNAKGYHFLHAAIINAELFTGSERYDDATTDENSWDISVFSGYPTVANALSEGINIELSAPLSELFSADFGKADGYFIFRVKTD